MHITRIQGVFLTGPPENVSRLPRLAPPRSFKCEDHIQVLRNLDIFIMGGRQSGSLTFFEVGYFIGQH